MNINDTFDIRVGELHIEVHKFRAGAIVLTAGFALILQAFLPVYFPKTGILDLPLLVTIYFGLSRRNPATGLERAHRSAWTLWHREDGYWLPRFIDRRAARYRTSRGALRSDRGFPGPTSRAYRTDAAAPAVAARAVVYGPPGDRGDRLNPVHWARGVETVMCEALPRHRPIPVVFPTGESVMAELKP